MLHQRSITVYIYLVHASVVKWMFSVATVTMSQHPYETMFERDERLYRLYLTDVQAHALQALVGPVVDAERAYERAFATALCGPSAPVAEYVSRNTHLPSARQAAIDDVHTRDILERNKHLLIPNWNWGSTHWVQSTSHPHTKSDV